MIAPPARLSTRWRDRGFVVPYTAFVDASSTVHFAVLDQARVHTCLTKRKCSLCGESMHKHIYFIGGPLCAANGIFYDPPMHKECAVYALQACPHLAREKGRYIQVPEIAGAAVTVGTLESAVKAERFALMHTTGFQFIDDAKGMAIISAVTPWLDVQWWKDGKPMEPT